VKDKDVVEAEKAKLAQQQQAMQAMSDVGPEALRQLGKNADRQHEVNQATPAQ